MNTSVLAVVSASFSHSADYFSRVTGVTAMETASDHQLGHLTWYFPYILGILPCTAMGGLEPSTTGWSQ